MHCNSLAEEGVRGLAVDLAVHRESEQADHNSAERIARCSPAVGTVGHNPVEPTGRNPAVHTLGARNSAIRSPVEVAAGHSYPKKDKEAGHIDWELRTTLRLAHHTIDPQVVETWIRPCYRKRSRQNQEAIWYATGLLAVPLEENEPTDPELWFEFRPCFLHHFHLFVFKICKPVSRRDTRHESDAPT